MLASNPFTHPLFATLLWSVLPLLAVGLGAVLFVERNRLSQLRQSSLFTQLCAGTVLGAGAILAILAGGFVFALLIMVAVIVGVLEYSAVTGLTNLQRGTVLLSGVAVVVAGTLGGAPALPAVLILSLIGVAFTSMYGSDGQNFAKTAVAALGVFYVPFLAVHAILLAKMPGGDGVLLALIAATALSDTGAFAMGKTFGKRMFNGKKLAPNLSPNKTWAGVVGSFIGAFAGLLLMRFAFSPPLATALLLAPIIAVTGIAGDLFESLMKRSFGVKDAGTWLPGFGGALDRIDAMLFVIPVSYYFLAL